MEPPVGLRKAAYSRHGGLRDYSYGSTGSVRLFRISNPPLLLISAGHVDL